MFLYEFDEPEGVMVSHRSAGSFAQFSSELDRAQKLLATSHGRPHRPKVHIITVDAEVVHAGASERSALASTRDQPEVLFALVCESATVRAASSVVASMQKHGTGAQQGAFATFDEAVAWVDGHGTGVRFLLGRLHAALQVQRQRQAQSLRPTFTDPSRPRARP